METAVRYFAHVQNKLQEVLEHELPNIEKAADFVVESCKQGGKFYVFGTYRRVCEGNGGDEHNHAMFEKYYGYWK